jgi:hypothetical protein
MYNIKKLQEADEPRGRGPEPRTPDDYHTCNPQV